MIPIIVEVVGVFAVAICAILIVRNIVKYSDNDRQLDNDERTSNGKILLFCAIWVLSVKIAEMVACGVFINHNPFDAELWYRASDIPHYIDIAKDGYVAEGFNAKWIVFFPLYPYILSVFGKITGEYFWTGSVLSMIFLWFALFLLYKLTEEEFGTKAAKRTIMFFMLFPTIFFAMLPMSEGLFFLLIISFMFLMKRRQLLLAAIVGALAAFTRSTGVVLVLPFCVECLMIAKEKGGVFKNFWLFVRKGAIALIIPIGTLAYLLINYKIFGDPFQFQIFQKDYWSQSLGFFGSTLNIMTDYMLNYTERPINFSLWGVQLIAIFFFIAVMIIYHKQRPSFAVLSFSIFIFSISAQWLLSAPRYLMAMLPAFMMLGQGVKKKYASITLATVLGGFSLFCLLEYLLKSCIY